MKIDRIGLYYTRDNQPVIIMGINRDLLGRDGQLIERANIQCP